MFGLTLSYGLWLPASEDKWEESEYYDAGSSVGRRGAQYCFLASDKKEL
jgi:hypothetical protein